MPCVMSHISWVQTLVNANGKNRSKVFFFPILPLSFTSTSPEACLDLRLKSGALVPTDSAISSIFDFSFRTSGFQVRKAYRAGSVKCQIRIHSGSQSCQHFLAMHFRLHLRPDFFDATIRHDQTGDAMFAQIFSAHETLLAPDAVSLDDLPVFIRYKGKWQFELLQELVVRFGRIDAHTEHHGALTLEFAEAIAKRARLLRATRRVVSGIKIKDDVLAFEISERDFATSVRQGSELWG